ncbi:MarR family winged helix-turn-helix transcriptional regulator [Devosia sp. A449]
MANKAWEALFRAQMTISQDLAESEAWGDLAPSEYGVLYALSTAKTGVRMSELTADVLLSQAGLSRLVARLEKRGLIERQPDPQDARASVLRLSIEGTHLQRRVGARHGRHVADVMASRLTPAQLIALRDLCQCMLKPSPAPHETDI